MIASMETVFDLDNDTEPSKTSATAALAGLYIPVRESRQSSALWRELNQHGSMRLGFICSQGIGAREFPPTEGPSIHRIDQTCLFARARSTRVATHSVSMFSVDDPGNQAEITATCAAIAQQA